MRWSDGSYLEDQDHWRLSGIHRDVLLLSKPQIFITDYFFKATMDENFSLADIEVEVEIDSHKQDWEHVSTLSIEAALYDNSGLSNSLDADLSSANVVNLKPKPKPTRSPCLGFHGYVLGGKIENPKLWSSEHPNLYTLVVLLKDAMGKLIECESCQVGIRNVVLAHKQMLVNGCPVVLRGVNRHEHHPRLGKTNIEACMIKVSDINPLQAIQTAISRKPPGWEVPWIPAERLSLDESLKAHTISAAYACFLDHAVGSLSEGKYADFVVLPSTSWDDFAGDLPAHVLATYVSGKLAYP